LRVSGGIALEGLIIRLLMLPGGISGTEETLRFISGEIGKEVCLSVMSQYYPAHKVRSCGELARRISGEDYSAVIKEMGKADLHAGWIQPFEGGFDERFAGENFPSSF
jgi:putative pyruvate formate lyase activating enzyme